MTPTHIGLYVVERELGRGGTGVVYLARHPELGRRVALKMLLSAEADPDALARFEREAQALARLHHPNLVGVHEAGVHDGRPFLAMDLVEGRSLQDRIDREGPLAPAEVAAIGETLARALHHAHERGLLHRDLKPSNVLLTAEGRAVVADFGLAKLLDVDAERLTRTGTTLGTPAFMAPEQVAGDSDVDRRADVYALGATLYALLSGRPPFSGPTALNVITAVVTHDPEPLLKLRPEVGADLDAVCRMCLAKAPDERYPTAEALADDLARVQRDEAVSATPQRPQSAGARATTLAALALASVLALLLLGALLALLTSP